MRIRIRPTKLKGRDHVGDVGVGGGIGLKMILKKTRGVGHSRKLVPSSSGYVVKLTLRTTAVTYLLTYSLHGAESFLRS